MAAAKRLYFGHPINIYNTSLETALLSAIAEAFPSWAIENPNHPVHSKGYLERRERTGNGMAYFYEDVLPGCEGGVFLPFRDGAWGAGVYGEAKFLDDAGKRTWTITSEGIITPADWNGVTALSVPQTVERIRTPEGARRPY